MSDQIKITWKSLGISDGIVSVIEEKFGFEKIADVQKRCIPLFLAHKDMIVQAPTGSGKTLAFVIPVLEILQRREERWKPWQVGALVLAPNRELAFQIADTFRTFLDDGDKDDLKLVTFVGGTKLETDVHNFKTNGGNIIIATPGRLFDLLGRSNDPNFNLSGHLKSLEVLILDEADRLLEMGFYDSMQEILTRLPKQRRTGLFSATQTDELEELSKTGLRNPAYVTVRASAPSSSILESSDDAMDEATNASDSDKVPTTLSNYYTIVPAEQKLIALRTFLRQHSEEKILVFLSSCACVDYFGDLLNRMQSKKRPKKAIKTKAKDQSSTILTLHGKKKQKRHEIFEQFRKRESGVLMCTDIMARGIDMDDIDWVVQFDPPRQASWFIHRCGRTARCGRTGSALVILTPSEEGYLEYLHRNQGVNLDNLDLALDEGQEWTMLEKIRKLASRSRELLEKGTRAFVSYLQAYSKHDCRIVCSLKELDVVNTAHSFGLLRLPKMPELAGRDLSGYRKCTIPTGDIPYEDKKREQARQNRLEEGKRDDRESSKSNTKQQSSRMEQSEPTVNEDEPVVMSKKNRRRKEMKDREELDDDYRLMKKFKKGKVSKEKFDAQFLA